MPLKNVIAGIKIKYFEIPGALSKCSISAGSSSTIKVVNKDIRVTSIAQRKARLAESSSFFGSMIAN
jgi:hypothetical protein